MSRWQSCCVRCVRCQQASIWALYRSSPASKNVSRNCVSDIFVIYYSSMAKPKKAVKKAVKKKPAKAAKRVKNVVVKAKAFRAVAAKRRAKLVPKKVAAKKVKAAPAPKLSPVAAKKQSDQNKKAESLMASGRQR